ncbi:Crp/Fnr family transcriptional regulator [Castellaniella sp.]|uniref:Crp/Fnr family transcriptional regulator n=1 Tax=Castellaniella sp. TaxID=1955812 RepID=UPI002B001C7F|nr:Crp/Fnr family transcriptional regulator [Castellaniella sp.]
MTSRPVPSHPDILAQLPYFQGVPATVLAPILQSARQLSVRRDEIIAHRGEPCLGMHIVVQGRIKLCYEAASGLERIMRIVSPNDSFGEALMYLGREYIASAEALCDSHLIYIPKDIILTQMAHSPQLSQQLVASLSRQLYMMMGDMGAYTVRNGHQRLIGYLLRASSHHQGVPVRLTIPKGVIASRLNLTPQHFSRILHDLIQRKLVRVQGREFTILDLQGLLDYRDQQAL